MIRKGEVVKSNQYRFLAGIAIVGGALATLIIS